MSISRAEYSEKLQGFWLGQNIANWTGLITEMDKVGTPETMPFYTDDDWGKPDLKAMWGEYVPHASHIMFYFQEQGQPWGSDDDTDIEYIYSFLHDQHRVSKLSAEQYAMVGLSIFTLRPMHRCLKNSLTPNRRKRIFCGFLMNGLGS